MTRELNEFNGLLTFEAGGGGKRSPEAGRVQSRKLLENFTFVESMCVCVGACCMN